MTHVARLVILRRSAGSVRRVMVKEKCRKAMAWARSSTLRRATAVESQVTGSPTVVIAMGLAALVEEVSHNQGTQIGPEHKRQCTYGGQGDPRRMGLGSLHIDGTHVVRKR